jgi:hypothetical protein
MLVACTVLADDPAQEVKPPREVAEEMQVQLQEVDVKLEAIIQALAAQDEEIEAIVEQSGLLELDVDEPPAILEAAAPPAPATDEAGESPSDSDTTATDSSPDPEARPTDG